MKIRILTSKSSWYIEYVDDLMNLICDLGHDVKLVNDHTTDDEHYDVTYMLSYFRLVNESVLRQSLANMVIHESDLPRGKGWSPLTWQIIEGENIIPITMFEADMSVDSGNVYCKSLLELNGVELIDEIRFLLSIKMKTMIIRHINDFPNITLTPQFGQESFYPKRTPEDSELDIDKTIHEQINLLRIVDNKRYPAFFIYNGHKYTLQITKESINEKHSTK